MAILNSLLVRYLLLEVSFAAEHTHDALQPMRNTLKGPACIRAQRGHHSFTLATAPVELPLGPWPLADSYQSTGPIIQSLSADSPGSHSLLNQGQWTYMADTRDLSATQPGLLPFVVHQALCHQPRQKDLGHRKMAQDAHLAAPWPWRATSLTRCCLRCWRKCHNQSLSGCIGLEADTWTDTGLPAPCPQRTHCQLPSHPGAPASI